MTSGPNWTLIIVSYFAVLAVLIVLLRPLHLSMGGIFFSMVAAGLVLASLLVGVKWLIHKVQAMNVSVKEVYHLAIGYEGLDGDEDPDDDEEPADPEPVFIEEDGLFLADQFQPSYRRFLCVMALIVGMRRSGKSTLLLALAVELGKYGLPFVLFDTQGEYRGLIHRRFLLRPYLAGNAEQMPELPQVARSSFVALSPENAYKFGAGVMERGAQVVVNLKSFHDEEAALVMSEIIDGVNDWQEARPNADRVPMMFFLDEAQKWLPQNRQDKAPDLSSETQGLLEEAFIRTVVELGGKNGLGLIVATQRYSRLKKDLLQSRWKFYLRQTEEIDLARYERQGIDPEEAKHLQDGQCIVFGPEVQHFTFTCRPSEVPHEGHTPGAENLAKYTHELDRKTGPIVLAPPQEQQQSPVSPSGQTDALSTPTDAKDEEPQPSQSVTNDPAALSKVHQQALRLYQEGHTSIRKLGAAMRLNGYPRFSDDAASKMLADLAARGLIER